MCLWHCWHLDRDVRSLAKYVKYRLYWCQMQKGRYMDVTEWYCCRCHKRREVVQ